MFSRKSYSPKYPDLYCNSLAVEKLKTQKHLGLKRNERLNFRENLKEKFAIVNIGTGMLRKLSNYLLRHSLVNLYKSFTRSHLDCVDIIYNKLSNINICNKIESLQCNAAITITEAIRGSSKEKMLQELGFEYLSSRRWLRKHCLFKEVLYLR